MAEDQEAPESITVDGKTYFLDSEGLASNIPLWPGKRKSYYHYVRNDQMGATTRPSLPLRSTCRATLPS